MKKINIIGAIACMVFLLQALSLAQPDEDLFLEAKVLIFDKKWKTAQDKLDELLRKFPESPFYSQAHFYKAKCLKEQKGKEKEALKVFKDYLRLKDATENLIEESELAIIDLAFTLLEKGEGSYLKEIEDRLRSANKLLRYYASLQISFSEDKNIAKKGLPVLEEILQKEKDEELKNRAKLAVLRIDPAALKDFGDREHEPTHSTLYIRVYKKGDKKPSFSLSIPWTLADLAFSVIPEKDKDLMRKEGYDLDRIIRQITQYKGDVLRIEDKDGTIEIWIK